MPRKPLPEGKLPAEYLAPLLEWLPRTGLVVPRAIGLDVGVTRSRGKYIIASSDPITGAKDRTGWYAVHVSANDVATSGIMPDALSIVMLLPEGTTLAGVQKILSDVRQASSELEITLGKGHTEVVRGLHKPIVVVTAYGSGDRFVTAAGAEAGDAILMTKTAGIEGTSILAGLPRVKRSLTPELRGRAESLVKKISIIPEANAAFKTGKVRAMHDVTEGGVVGAVLEMGVAAGLGFELDIESIPVDASTSAICESLSIDPTMLIGSGALVLSCAEADTASVIHAIRAQRITCTRIGSFVGAGSSRNLHVRGATRKLTEGAVKEQLWPALTRFG